MNSWLLKSMGFVLLSRRKATGLSLAQAAALCGIAVRELTCIERGTRDADLTTLSALSAAVGITLEELFAEAYNRDSERIVVCTDLLTDVDSLSKPHREVVTVGVDQLAEAMRNWRIDLLIVDKKTASSVITPNSGSPGKPRTSLIMLDKSSDGVDSESFARVVCLQAILNVPKMADVLLQALPKGRICNLRRMQDRLRVRRQELAEQKLEVLRKQTELHVKMAHLIQRQLELTGDMDEKMHDGHSIMVLFKKLRKYGDKLEQAVQKLDEEERAITAAGEFERHRSMFLKRSELGTVNDRELL